MIASPASFPRITPSASTADLIRLARLAARAVAATTLLILVGLLLADVLAAVRGHQIGSALSTGGGARLLLACPALLLALDALVLAPLQRLAGARRTVTHQSGIRYVGCDAAELVARGRVTLVEDGPGVASYLFGRAIAADPYCEEAWLLKAACQDSRADRVACLEAGLALNPTSAPLKEALA